MGFIEYEPQNIIVEAGENIIVDYAKDSVLLVQRNEKFTPSKSGFGREVNTDMSGSIIFTLQISSGSNKVLRNYLKAGKENFPNDMFPLMIKDLSQNVLHKLNSAWVKPPIAYPQVGVKSGEIKWIIETDRIEDVLY